MKLYDQLTHPTHCFCQIPKEELGPWVHKRYVENRSTIELLNSTENPHEKEIISIVAMLDVDEELLLSIMDKVSLPEHHILSCRRAVKRMLGL